MSFFRTKPSGRQAKQRRRTVSRPPASQNFRGLRIEALEERRLLAVVNLGVAPGVHIAGEALDAGVQDWYQVQVLRAGIIDFGLGFDPGQGVLNLGVLDSQGDLVASGVQSPSGATAVATFGTTTDPPGTYLLEVSGQTPATSNVYALSADFDVSDGGTVYYVNDPANQGNDFYTLAPGNDSNSGLSPQSPKATVQSVLAEYNVGPADMIVVDTGNYNQGTITLDSNHQGVVLAGSPGGSVFSYAGTALQLNNADQNLIYNLQFSGNSTGIDSQAGGLNTLTGNTIENDTFQDDSCAISLSGGGNDTIEGNTITGGGTGISLSGWSGSDTISQNTISARARPSRLPRDRPNRRS